MAVPRSGVGGDDPVHALDVGEAGLVQEKMPALIDTVGEFAEERRFRVESYAQLAASLGVSLSGLRRHVRKAAGLPLHRLVRAQRLRQARYLLKNTDQSLAEIATALHRRLLFNWEFTRLAGLSPGAYRRSRL